jgi:hypothetical protein
LIGGLLVLSLVSFWVFGGAPGGSGSGSQPGRDSIGAWVDCREFVTQN